MEKNNASINPLVMRVIRECLEDFATVLVSRPGVGKGELAKNLAALNLTVIPCSGVLREMGSMNPDDDGWQKVLKDMDQGILADDEHTIQAMNWKVGNTGTCKPVFDGFPRNEVQVCGLGEILLQLRVPCLVIELKCTREEARKRCDARIKKAHLEGKAPRDEDVNITKWGGRQDEYESTHPALSEALHGLATSYVTLDTTHGSMEENHAKILSEILWFAMSWHRRKP